MRSKDIVMVPVENITPRPDNRNKHSDEQIQRLSEIIQYQGFRDPLIISNQTQLLVSGHGRVMAAKKLGLKELPVIYQDFDTPEQEYAAMVSENSIASWAELDFSGINTDLVDLGPDFNIDMLGIENFEIDVADKDGLTDPDDVPEPPKEPKTKRGDIYKLGNHKLMCGDSTMIDDVEKLVNIESVTMCFTSPPYNLGDNAKLRGYNGDGKDSAYLEKSDHKSQIEYLQFLNDFTSICVSKCTLSFINIQLLAGNKLIMPEYWNNFRDRLVDLMVWDKEHAAPQMAARVLNSVFEMIYIFSNEQNPKRSIKTGPEFRGTVQNVFRLNPMRGKKDESQKDHGAVFPVAFPEYFIESFTDKNDTVYEPFCGSGTTIIACEKLNRIGFGMELDPRYCDVIVSRWENFTGQKAELIN